MSGIRPTTTTMGTMIATSLIVGDIPDESLELDAVAADAVADGTEALEVTTTRDGVGVVVGGTEASAIDPVGARV